MNTELFSKNSKISLFKKALLKKVQKNTLSSKPSKVRNQSKVAHRWKLKKKWRFWRLFKNFFLIEKKKNSSAVTNSSFFTKLKIFYNYKRIVIKQYNILYNLAKSKSYNFFSKYFGGVKFIKVLTELEMRFSVVVLRLFFAKNITQAENLIKDKKILINNTYKNFKYTLKPKDLLRKVGVLNYKNFFTLYFEKKEINSNPVKYLQKNHVNNNLFITGAYIQAYKLWLSQLKWKKHNLYFGKLLFSVWNILNKNTAPLLNFSKKTCYKAWVADLNKNVQKKEMNLKSIGTKLKKKQFKKAYFLPKTILAFNSIKLFKSILIDKQTNTIFNNNKLFFFKKKQKTSQMFLFKKKDIYTWKIVRFRKNNKKKKNWKRQLILISKRDVKKQKRKQLWQTILLKKKKQFKGKKNAKLTLSWLKYKKKTVKKIKPIIKSRLFKINIKKTLKYTISNKVYQKKIK